VLKRSDDRSPEGYAGAARKSCNLQQAGLGPAFELESRTRETTLQIGIADHFF
jgi:hypothetical protein